MSYCKKEGKDVIMFITEEDDKKPSRINLSNDIENEPGLILENGDINWNCPCLGGMATGPCGYEFRSAFSCFHDSTSDPKGSDCFEDFRRMTDCMTKYPKLYESGENDERSATMAMGEDEEEDYNVAKEERMEEKKTDLGSKNSLVKKSSSSSKSLSNSS